MRPRSQAVPATLCMALLLSACGGGGVSNNGSESFISGNGAVTFISQAKRLPAPQIKGQTLEGSIFNQDEKKIIVLNVWASWCVPCRAEAPTLVELSKKYPDVQFIGILTRDNAASAKSFIKRFEITYPTLKDDSLLLGFRTSLIANAIPSTLIVDKNGKVAGRISGEVTVASLTQLIERVDAE